MPVKLCIDTRQAYPHSIIVEISTGDDDNQDKQSFSISPGPSSKFGCRLKFSGDKMVVQEIQTATEGVMDGKSGKKTSKTAIGRIRNHIKSLQGWQRYRRASWHLPGSKLSSRGELLFNAHLTSHGTNDNAELLAAAQEPVGQDALSNGLLPMCQRGLTVQEAAHHPADFVQWLCNDAQPGGHSRGRGNHGSVPFVGTVGRPPSLGSEGVTKKAMDLKLLKSYTCIPLIVPSLTGGRPERFSATMDTGAEANVITRKLFELLRTLGYTLESEGTGMSIPLINHCRVETLGKIKLSFHLLCNPTLRSAEFHVVEDLGRHQALLSVELIIELEHLVRSRCRWCGPIF